MVNIRVTNNVEINIKNGEKISNKNLDAAFKVVLLYLKMPLFVSFISCFIIINIYSQKVFDSTNVSETAINVCV